MKKDGCKKGLGPGGMTSSNWWPLEEGRGGEWRNARGRRGGIHSTQQHEKNAAVMKDEEKKFRKGIGPRAKPFEERHGKKKKFRDLSDRGAQTMGQGNEISLLVDLKRKDCVRRGENKLKK